MSVDQVQVHMCMSINPLKIWPKTLRHNDKIKQIHRKGTLAVTQIIQLPAIEEALLCVCVT